MKAIAKFARIFRTLLLISFFILGMAGCSVANIESGTEPLPSVASLPLPQLPDWIEQISPTGEAESLAQIRIRFRDPLIPVEEIDSTNQKDLLNKLAILPALPGKFRFLTPRMVGFQADQAIPKATRVQVTLKAGLSDLKSHRLEQDFVWTFHTPLIQLTNLPGTSGEVNDEAEPIDLKPTLTFNSNLELDLNSLQDHVKLIPEGTGKSIDLKVDLKKAEEQQTPDNFDPSSQDLVYTITPQQTLEKDTNYRLEFSPGLRPNRGNLPSETKFFSKVSTYAPLAFEKIESYGQPDAGGAYGRFVKGSPQLKFNNGLVAASALENITIKPAPKKNLKVIQAYDDDNIVGINPWALEPDTNYNITFASNLKDKFGQTLDKPITLNYNTGDVAADIWTPTGLNIFPSGTNLQLNISTVNLPEYKYQAAYRVVEPTDLVYTDSAYPRGYSNDLLPKSNSWTSFSVRGRKNQANNSVVPLKEKLGTATGMLAYGVKAKTNFYQQDGKKNWREPEFYGLVQLTNLGVFAQWFPDSGLIRVNHLDDGSAAENATVEVYKSQLEAKSKVRSSPCAIATTDLTGTAIIGDDNWQQCLQNKEAPELLVIVRENEDWAFTRTDQYSGAYEYGIDAGWNNNKPQSRGIIFSDRQLYQPGEKAELTGTAYYLQNGVLKQDKNIPYQVTLVNPDGKEVNLETQTTNQFGTFSLELPLDKNQPLGYYSIRAKGESGAEIYGDFRVAEFNPPNFKVDLKLDQEFALVDQKVTANATSNYLFGSPVEGGKIKYYVTRQKADFIPKGWDNFSFGNQWFWPEEPPEVPNDVLQANQILDNTGKNSQQIAVAKDLPYPMTYRVEVQVSDVSNLSVSNTQTFTALPINNLIGLQNDFVGDAGQPFPIKIIVTDPTGKVVSGEKIRVELQQMNYSSITQLQEGSRTSRNQVEYKTVAQQEIRSEDKPQTLSFTISESGSYRIHANFVNSKDDITATDSQIWVTGDNLVSWGNRYQNNRLEIKLDKAYYQPGEMATALIQSPYPDAELYFAVVRHNNLYSTVQKVTGSTPKIHFQVTPEMLPNAAVEAVLFRQGKPISQVEPGSIEDLVRIGFTSFKINLDDKYLQVKITPQQEQQEPGTQQTVTLTLQDHQKQPIEGQFTVVVVNEAILQLTGYRLPDLVKTVYADQQISTRLADNRSEVVLTTPASPLEKGWGYGGGESRGIANTNIRKDFQALAYYNSSVLTDTNGQANVTFKLPDDLTTWRVMVVATDGDLHFGNEEATFITTKPLISHAILPQFVRLGDRFLGGLSITNTTGKTGNLTINASLTDNLQFAYKSSLNDNLQTKAESGTHAYRFPLLASKIGEGKVQFFSQLNNSESDAFEVPLEVKDLAITEQVIEFGTTTNQVNIPLEISNKVVANVGGLDISLASTLIPQITAPAKQVLEDNEFPFLESSASQLSIAANLQILGQKYSQILTNFNPTEQANQALENLQKLQQPDGGFASIPTQETTQSDPFVTPYAAESIAQAQAAGFPINDDIIKRLQNYLNNILANPGQYEFCNTLSCKNQIRLEVLIALDILGEKRQDFLRDIYVQREQLDEFNQIKLARYLSQFPEWQAEANTLSNQIQETIYQTGRTAKLNIPENWRWFNSNTATQAQALRLFIAQNNNPEIVNRLLQGLLEMRRDGTWQNSYDNAQALSSLVKYSKLQPTPPKYNTTVQLAGKQLGKVRFEGYDNSSFEIKVPRKELPRGRNELILKKSGQGTLHYLTSYRYRPQGNQPGRLNGLRVTRYIRPANQATILHKIGLYSTDKPITLPVGQIFDINLEIITDHRVDHLMINDPLPAGLESVDTSFQTSSSYFQPQQNSWQISYQKIYKDKVLAYGDRLDAGVYNLHYLVRSVTPGTFEYPGAEVHLQYAPEEFGRSASSTLEVGS